MFKLKKSILNEIKKSLQKIDGLILIGEPTFNPHLDDIEYYFTFKAENDEKQLKMLKEVCLKGMKGNAPIQVYDDGRNLGYQIKITMFATLEVFVPESMWKSLPVVEGY